MKKTIIKWIGKILMVLSIVVIVAKVWEYHESLKIILTIDIIGQMVICCLLYAVMIYMNSYVYKKALEITTGSNVSYIEVADIYCKSNIYKYLPGNIMQFIGRNEIAVKNELAHSEVALATVLEIAAIALSSLLVALVFAWKYAVEWLAYFIKIDVRTVFICVLAIITIGEIVFIAVWKKISNYLKKFITLKNVLRMIWIIIYGGVIRIINGLIYYYALSMLGIHMEMHYYLIGIGLYSLAFLLGYVTIGAPGGIGIRESVMLYFFTAFMEESEVLTGALIFRIISIIGDFIAFVVAATLCQKVQSKNA